MSSTTAEAARGERRAWPAYRTLWIALMLGWTVSAADRTITGPVVTWMIGHDVGFLHGAANPHALGGLVGGLFFAGYMLTQWPGGYLGDRFGHRTVIVISLFWAGVATIVSGLVSGLVIFVAMRVFTGLGEGAFYSNDRSLITADTPLRKRSLGMGVAITGLAFGITIATVFAPNMISLGAKVFGGPEAWRMAFVALGAVTLVVAVGVFAYFRRREPGLPYFRATGHMLRYAAPCLVAVMAVYWLGTSAGLSDLAVAGLEIVLAVAMLAFVFRSKAKEVGPAIKNRDLLLIYASMFAVLWNLWFFSFWAVAIVGDAAHSSFGKSALIAAFNAGAGLLGFPAGGWLSDWAVQRGWGRKGMLLSFTAIQCVLTVAFGFVIASSHPNVWLMAGLLFSASLFFNALQPISHAIVSDIAPEGYRGAAFGMDNLIGEMGAVLSPAVSGALRDATGGWSAAVFLDAGIIACAFVLLCFVRERQTSSLFREVSEREPTGRFTREREPVARR
ncbi:MAG TPA: MFS transporter [Solirubrobacteraceae bacterium]